jgi:phosphatidylinositol alpha-1,6-mannosyltransferase
MKPPRSDSARSSVLLGLTGLHIEGGIAAVSRCIARALEDEIHADRLHRTDRVLLLENPTNSSAPPARGEQHTARGSHARFVWQAWRLYRRYRHDLVLFDLVGLARSVGLPLPGFPPQRIAIFAHGQEVAGARRARNAPVLQRAQLVLANSHFTANRLRAELPEISDRLRVVPLCIDPERVAAWENAVDARPAPRERAALIVGRMWAEQLGKGHDELLESWPSVRRQVPDAELWIVGGGEDATRLKDKARRGGVGDSVRFLGRVSDAELGALYRRASVFAMPSQQEGFGLVYAEAMWWGLPCVGSTADAAGQVIVAGETGELVPYRDAGALARVLVRLFSDPERAIRMGEAGRRRAREHFGYERFRSDLLTALELG